MIGRTIPKRQAVQRAILRWYSRNRRCLPWRRTHDPYRILVSEIMLQQTQVDRIIPKYRAWLKRFPNMRTLSRARPATVIAAWQGIGYNRRVLNLLRCAQAVMREYGGRLPDDVAALERLPGIGPYTARAVASFAFGRDVAVMDVNVERVVHRVMHGPEQRQMLPTDSLRRTVDRVLLHGRSHDWNSALMDFGSLICTAKKPACAVCPLRSQCAAYPDVLVLPVRRTQRRESTAPRTNTPNRIIRGRVVEALRSARPRAITADRLARTAFPSYRPSDRTWFAGLLAGLVRDGLIHLTGQKRNPLVSLPASYHPSRTSHV